MGEGGGETVKIPYKKLCSLPLNELYYTQNCRYYSSDFYSQTWD